MPFGLTIGTERAAALQQSIQDELTKRGYSPDADPVMAEYITIMIINNKTAAQITSELEDLIGSDFNPSFTEWLFEEAAKGSTDSETPPQSSPAKVDLPAEPEPGPSREVPPPVESPRTQHPPRNGVYQHALSQALPSTSNSAQKRSASARSPSPSHPNKARRTDLPTGPRAMYRDGQGPNGQQHNPRSLLDRVGGPAGRGQKNFQRDEIQARIDNIVSNAPDMNMMVPPGFPGVGMDMNAMAAANMANPLMLQEMMMNQMALMAQMASSMGIINPATGQFAGPGFPMQQGGMQPDMGMFPPNMNTGMPQQQGNNVLVNGAGRGRGGARGGRGTGRGRGGSIVGSSVGPTGKPASSTTETEAARPSPPVATPAPIAAPTPVVAAPTPTTQAHPAYALPERPQSPTLCKFGLKCTNAHCRYSHPSPVATAESGVVLSNDPCEKGKNCKDKDCVKAHVSPAVLNPKAEHSIPAAAAPPPHVQHTPSSLSLRSCVHHKSMTFNNPNASMKEKLEKQMKEIQEKKSEAEKAIKEAESKKDGAKPVSIAA
ncbi:hypothetical protein NLJ89_g3899 [Agrocybe chaxingu]|uniref:Nab2 type CCCH zinc finger 4 domain-containing protein n=1 Tax=Agrocybe chaxingu TaxID=84603 RepID=A0A9W8K9D0_9AGAR|nr:hypothetical protein NLJ89_g3899 [Agrocybe chaxingu]